MKHLKKALALFLTLLTLVCIVSAVTASAYNAGDNIVYGNYPQTLIKDTIRIDQFNQILENAQTTAVSEYVANTKNVLAAKLTLARELYRQLYNDGRFGSEAQALYEKITEADAVAKNSKATLTDYKEAIELLQNAFVPVKEAVDAVGDSTVDTSFMASVWEYREPTFWKSYGYYSGTGNRFDGAMTSGDYMQYYDFTHGTEKYRAVKILSYRPNYTGYAADNDQQKTYQDDYGYEVGKVYYFHFEPLNWTLLDAGTGLMVCNSVIDSQPFQSVVYEEDGAFYTSAEKKNAANDYKSSTLHHWIIRDFFETAFTRAEQNSIPMALIAFNDGTTASERVFLPSISDVTNKNYGFAAGDVNDTARKVSGTDYARCMGLYKSTDNRNGGLAPWWLRDSAAASGSASCVSYAGKVQNEASTVDLTYVGIRPACYVNNVVSEADLCKFCGKQHGTSFFQRIIAFFHSIFAFIRRTDINMG